MRNVLSIAMAALACASGCGADDNGAGGGSVKFTASGEVLALGGYSFPPAQPGDPAFVDGWELRFDRLLVTVDSLTLSDNPDRSPTDQSQSGAAVGRLTGPWAIDLHKGGPLPGKGGSDEQAVALATLDNQNLADGASFDDTVRYGFGFDVVPASAAATRVNLDSEAAADYELMIQSGLTVLYVGTATFRGTACTATGNYDFAQFPGVVHFRFGFTSPASYVNCQNPDNDPATPFGGEEHQRGVQVKANATTIAQLTLHSDHPFWDSFLHEAPAHFDQLAARAQIVGGVATVTLDDAVGVDFTAFTDANGAPLPWRSCLASYTPPDTAPNMHFDAQGTPYSPTGNPATALRDYRDFMTYNQSTQGHINSDGLCFVKRNYPSPP